MDSCYYASAFYMLSEAMRTSQFPSYPEVHSIDIGLCMYIELWVITLPKFENTAHFFVLNVHTSANVLVVHRTYYCGNIILPP